MLRPNDLAKFIVNSGSVAAVAHFTASTIKYLLLAGAGRAAQYVFCAAKQAVIKDSVPNRTTALVTFLTLAVSMVVAAGPAKGMPEYILYYLNPHSFLQSV